MLTVVDPTGRRAGAQALVAALVLVPVSLVPALSPQAGSAAVYCLWAVLLGAGQLAARAAVLQFTATTHPPGGCCARRSCTCRAGWRMLLLIAV